MTATPFMAEALALGEGARGATSPNPWVGAVVVRDGAIVGRGATEPPGGRHAEAVALAEAGELARGADLYVTLEPCVPFEGKRTPACAEAIMAAGVRRVLVALEDGDVRVAGRGIAYLRERGVEVALGDAAAEARASLRPYLKHRRTGLPWVIAKFAASLDGRTATASGDSKWITGEAARERAHRERARVDAVLVGSGTVLADDPALTARPGGLAVERQPVRVILDARGRTPPEARLFAEAGPLIVATTSEAAPSWKAAIQARGAQVLDCERGQAGVNLDQLLRVLGQRGILSLWAEGGGTVLGSLFDGGHVDEMFAFLAPVIVGGRDALPAVGGEGAALVAQAWRLHNTRVEQIGEDILVNGLVRD